MIATELLSVQCRACRKPRGEHGGAMKQGACPDGGRRWTPPEGSRKQAYAFRSPLPGGGPWRVLDECVASRHNTIHAGKGSNGQAKCICPRAVAENRRRNKEWSQSRHRRYKEEKRYETPRKVIIRQPDMSRGECARPRNRATVDAAFEGMAGYMAMKQLCSVCPLRTNSCLEYVTAAESPAGSWGGIWAGMSPRDRIRHAKEAK